MNLWLIFYEKNTIVIYYILLISELYNQYAKINSIHFQNYFLTYWWSTTKYELTFHGLPKILLYNNVYETNGSWTLLHKSFIFKENYMWLLLSKRFTALFYTESNRVYEFLRCKDLTFINVSLLPLYTVSHEYCRRFRKCKKRILFQLCSILYGNIYTMELPSGNPRRQRRR